MSHSFPLGPQVLDIAQRVLSLMGLCEGWYVCFYDLHRLSLSHSSTCGTLVNARVTPSPINWDRLASCLAVHPDQRLAAYVLAGIRHGFQIGVSGPVLVHSSSRNHPSCLVCPSAVGSYLASEQSAGRMLGPLQHCDLVHISPIGLVPKGHQGDASSFLNWRHPEVCHKIIKK